MKISFAQINRRVPVWQVAFVASLVVLYFIAYAHPLIGAPLEIAVSLATVFGFLGDFAYTWYSRGALPTGRSHCDTCNTALSPIDMFPVVGYALSGGKCQYSLADGSPCTFEIPSVYPRVEAVGMLIGLAIAAPIAFWLYTF